MCLGLGSRARDVPSLPLDRLEDNSGGFVGGEVFFKNDILDIAYTREATFWVPQVDGASIAVRIVRARLQIIC